MLDRHAAAPYCRLSYIPFKLCRDRNDIAELDTFPLILHLASRTEVTQRHFIHTFFPLKNVFRLGKLLGWED